MKLLPVRRKSAAFLWWILPIIAIGGWFYPFLGLWVIVCMLAPVIIGAFRGRYWCGWFCPRGAFYDYVMPRFSRNSPAPRWLRSRWFRLLAMAFLICMMTMQISLAWPHPAQIARVFVLLLGVTTLVGIVLAVIYKPRTWCTFCQMGTMASWVSHGKRPIVVADSCTNCQICEKNCPMDISPITPDKQHTDCLKCAICVSRCPRKALSFWHNSAAKVSKNHQPIVR